MPIIEKSSYKGPSRWLFNGHLETILPSLFRKIDGVNYKSIEISTRDQDTLTLDTLINKKNTKALVITHGMEGDSERHYVKGLAKYYFERGFDIIAWNCRTCGKSQNKTHKLYHHADILDLGDTIEYVTNNLGYKNICIIGFSMGGSMTLNYLGKSKSKNLKYIKSAVAVSVPCDLYGCVKELHRKRNSVYKNRFISKLNKKIKAKSEEYPEIFSRLNIEEFNDFENLDKSITAPLYGFKNEQDYYKEASSKYSIPNIKTPTLIINAKNDPMLSESCYPYELAKNHPYVYLECPKRGGHTGFTKANQEFTWAEKRSYEFTSKYH